MGQAPRPSTGWHRTDEWRLNGFAAMTYAGQLEETGRVWASAVSLAQGCALVELRSRKRPYPLIQTLRTAEECADALLRFSAGGEGDATAFRR